MLYPVIPGVIVYIITGFCIRRPIFFGILDRSLIWFHSPSLKEWKNVLICRRTCETHQILVNTAIQHKARLRRFGRISRIRIYSGKEQIAKLFFIIIKDMFIIRVIVKGQMELPVQRQLCGHIR